MYASNVQQSSGCRRERGTSCSVVLGQELFSSPLDKGAEVTPTISGYAQESTRRSVHMDQRSGFAQQTVPAQELYLQYEKRLLPYSTQLIAAKTINF